ncbi:hypothetical protein [Methylocapsa sp. S129]|uniref:hypothetical protein n=1 Tax=Methylocapsa sp. S129 TaxID=1641869 RepID=UPI00131DE1DB|nr:hypothetical protein [Methylocapsa sp. S129]
MAAPFIVLPAAFATFLAGAHLAPWIAGAGVVITDIDGVAVDLGRLCKATDPLLDALADRAGSARWLVVMTHAADRICAAAAAGSGVAGDIGLIAETLQAISSVQAELRSVASVAPVANDSIRRKTER